MTEKTIHEQTWWDKNLDTKMDEFKGWIGDYTAPSKVLARQYVAMQEYKSILDCGCGVCTEYYGYKADGYSIQYKGLDATKKLVDLANRNGIDVVHGYLEKMPFQDKSHDIVFIRHILEHLPFYEDALNEAMRVASKEVLVIWFLKPTNSKDDKIDYHSSENLFHNVYNLDKLVGFIKSNPRFDSLEWFDINHQENMMSIKLKE